MTRLGGEFDCGTNSIRLLIADALDGQLRDVHREMRIVRLGQGVDATGRLRAGGVAAHSVCACRLCRAVHNPRRRPDTHGRDVGHP